MSKPIKAQILGWIPYVIGVILVVQFAGLGVWQVSRGLEKSAEQQAFNSQAGFAAWSDGMEVRSFQKLKATGHFESARQILLENIIINSRLGYYVLSPLRVADDVPLLLVNRGWFERSGADIDATLLELEPSRVAVRGRAGSLPKAGYRMGRPFPLIPAGQSSPSTRPWTRLQQLSANRYSLSFCCSTQMMTTGSCGIGCPKKWALAVTTHTRCNGSRWASCLRAC